MKVHFLALTSLINKAMNDEINDKMNKERVSAIITTHNRDPQIVLRAINSVLNQTYDQIELIIVDDSDNDYPKRKEVENAVRKASNEILLIKHDTCRGPCAARNTGLLYAIGCYVAFLDDDDEWVPTKIEEQIKGFSDSSIGLVYSGITHINELKNERYAVKMPYKRGYVFDELLRGNFIGSTSSPLIKKQCLVEVGDFDISLQSAQDYDMWLRIAKRYPINCIEKQLLNYYVHTGERISGNLDKQIAGKERINAKYIDDISKDNKTWYLRHRKLVAMYAKKKCRKKAFMLWYRCFMKYPWNVVDHTKSLLLIIFGFDSVPYRIYQKMKLLDGQLRRR